MSSKQTWVIGDYRELLSTIPDKSINLLLTDPPYNKLRVTNSCNDKLDSYLNSIEDLNLHNFDVLEFLNLVAPKMKYFHSYIFSNLSSLSTYIKWIEDRKYHWNLLIMAKRNPVPVSKKNKYLSDKEYILFIREPNKCYFDNDLPFNLYRSVKSIVIGKRGIHPTQKPLHIIEELISVSSTPSHLILDPFMGSGTTMQACVNLERNFIGFDILDTWQTEYARIISSKKNQHNLLKHFKFKRDKK